MTRDQVFDRVRQITIAVLPDISAHQIEPASTLEDLGAHSVERADIIMECLEVLNLDLPLSELAICKDVGSLVTLLHRHVERERPSTG